MAEYSGENSLVAQMLRTSMGPIRPFFENPEIVEIMLNADQRLWIEKMGHSIEDTGIVIKPEQARQFINIIASACRAEIHEGKPVLSAELPYFGSRFQGMIPPVTINPVFSIRQPALRILSLDDYVTQEIITATQQNRITAAIEKRENILLVGGTGSGKTTMINTILARMAETKYNRIFIIEDTRELQGRTSNLIFTRVHEGVSQRELVKCALRMRPDRIVVGEVRDAAALDIVKAWQTGHPGGAASIHANNAYGGLLRMEQLIMESGAVNQEKLIGEVVNLLIFIERTAHGRRVQEIAEVKGYRNGEYVLEYVR